MVKTQSIADKTSGANIDLHLLILTIVFAILQRQRIASINIEKQILTVLFITEYQN
jgi:hypothetical protein